MKAIKLTIVVLGLCVFTLVMSWFLVLNVYAYFIDDAPYVAGTGFYIAEIIFTFLFYVLASFAAIKITRLPPFVAALPIGIIGLVVYYLEMGGLSCFGVCGAPLWYDLSSFFKHLPASVLASLIVLYRLRAQAQLAGSSPASSLTPSPKPSSFNYKTPLLVFVMVGGCVMLWGGFVFSNTNNNTQTVLMYSTSLGEERKAIVYLPDGYDENKKYDVLYTLDGESFKSGILAAVTARVLTDVGLIPPIILVAIDGHGKRKRDFNLANAKAIDGRDLSGAASVYYKFLTNELIPNIDQTFSTTGQQLLSGHSFGGIFTAYAFIENPDIFDGYFAFSPSFNDNDKLVEMFKVALTSKKIKDKYFYMNLGIEGSDMRASFKQAEIALRDESPATLKSKVSYSALPHALIMVPGFFNALYWYYQNRACR